MATATRSWTVGPTLPISGAPDLTAQALSRVIKQYKYKPKLAAAITSLSSLGQDLMNCLVQMPTLDDPTIAMGVNLDVVGDLVGQDRQIGDGNVATDGELQVLIGARISRNNARVSLPDYLTALGQFFGARIVIVDHEDMAISYTVMRAPTSDEIALLNGDIVARPMGVKVTRSFVATVPYFGFQGDPNAGGFSDHTGTVGAPLAQEF